MSMPRMVTTGSSALRRMCERSTRLSGAPLPLAVRTKSSFIVSITFALISRA